MGLLKGTLSYAPTIPALAFMAFQLMFAAITLGTITSAMAEKMKLSAFIVFGILWTTCLCSISSMGMGGWLAKLGALVMPVRRLSTPSSSPSSPRS